MQSDNNLEEDAENTIESLVGSHGWKCLRCEWSQYNEHPEPPFTEKPCECCWDFKCPECGGAVEYTDHPINEPSFPDQLRSWCKMIDANSAHPEYTKELLNKAANLIDFIDKECLLGDPHVTLPERVQKLINEAKSE